jgi:crotonobetainyl-CoA:carnitine CoA-transferase CaiB-like acyl-CoA transferase
MSGTRQASQRIDLSLLDTQVASLANQNMNYLVTGESPGAPGHRPSEHVPY